MKVIKERIPAIEYMRGIGMLGVVAIHIGSQYLVANPTPNLQLLALYEIFTRFSVPIFFFISAFGLFYNLDISKPFSYGNFMKKRLKTVLVPYLVWSIFYLALYAVMYHDIAVFFPGALWHTLFFGLACYQLYFMVLLLWFYVLMPLWIWCVKRLNLNWLILIFIVQIAFDYYSSYKINVYTLPDTFWKPFLVYRLNYIVLHYIFIFLLGGYLAVHYQRFKAFMQQNLNGLRISGALSLAGLLGYYYYCIYHLGYPPEGAVNTAHQLSPLGLVYTLCSSLYLFAECQYGVLSRKGIALEKLFGKHSYFIYLGHPVAIMLMKRVYEKFQIVMTGVHSLIFYVSVVAITLVVAIIVRKLSAQYAPWFNEISIGVYKKKK